MGKHSIISARPDLFFELPDLEYDREALISITKDARYQRFTFNWYLEITHDENGGEKHVWTVDTRANASDMRTIDFGNLRERWLHEHDDGTTDQLRKHPAVMQVINRVNPEIVITPDKFHINMFSPGATYPAHIDKGRDSVIMLPLDPEHSCIEFHVDGETVKHTYRYPTVLNVKKLHYPVPEQNQHRLMSALAINGTSYQRCLELAMAGEFLV